MTDLNTRLLTLIKNTGASKVAKDNHLNAAAIWQWKHRKKIPYRHRATLIFYFKLDPSLLRE